MDVDVAARPGRRAPVAKECPYYTLQPRPQTPLSARRPPPAPAGGAPGHSFTFRVSVAASYAYGTYQ